MNIIMPNPSGDLSNKRMVLATDLDGTFLGGTDDERTRLYDWIEQNRKTVGLVFVSGRDPEFIVEICGRNGIPWPDYVIGDVGTTIARVTPQGKIAPIPELEREIAEKWADKGDHVRRELDGHPGLRLQPTDFRYRVSYDYDPENFHPSAKEKVSAIGCDYLISDNRFFDVLPVGVSKGPSLKRLVSHLEIDAKKVLTAGDTLNDLSMLLSGLPAVAVGGSEAGLLAHVEPLPHVHKADAIGAAGILEAIDAFGLHDIPRGE